LRDFKDFRPDFREFKDPKYSNGFRLDFREFRSGVSGISAL